LALAGLVGLAGFFLVGLFGMVFLPGRHGTAGASNREPMHDEPQPSINAHLLPVNSNYESRERAACPNMPGRISRRFGVIRRGVLPFQRMKAGYPYQYGRQMGIHDVHVTYKECTGKCTYYCRDPAMFPDSRGARGALFPSSSLFFLDLAQFWFRIRHSFGPKFPLISFIRFEEGEVQR
jgi:hypothetical protein